MYIYLPIAEMSINVFLVVGIGGAVGFLSGLFGVGGGFLLTPLMMMIGIPPAVAAASDSNQIVAAAASGATAHYRMGNVDIKLGLVILAGGILGGTLGVQAVKTLRELGNFDFVIRAVYVLMLGTVGGFMFLESVNKIRRTMGRTPAPSPSNVTAPPQSPKKSFFSRLPLQVEFSSLAGTTSLLFPLGAGAAVGFLAAIMGVGGGFIMVPVMIYILGMPTVKAIGTDLFQIVLVSANVTLQQAIRNHTVDLVLAITLFCGSVIGAQFGARVSRLLKGEQLRIFFSVIVLAMMFKLLIDLITAPENVIGAVAVSGGH
ncbi:MAG: sulfite exporter TauE/SafE family protein [Candidatus Omnitrophica bacterium]|nr:sulfite exporter TauE/SafE family protein [Candidatus Omnitrophota bacterium]